MFGFISVDFSYQSDDYGVSWQFRRPLRALNFLLLDTVEPDRMYGIENDYSGEQLRRLYKTSIDNGESWQEWASRPCIADDFVDPYSTSPSLVSVGSGQLWARCKDSRGWHYSPDAGDTWRPMGAADAHLLVADAGHPGHALMVNDNGFWRSVNGGEWRLVTADFSAPPPVYYLPLALRQ